MSPRPNRGGEYGHRPRTPPIRAAALPAGPDPWLSTSTTSEEKADEALSATAKPSYPARPELASLLPPDWEKAVYLALDFETTGLDPSRERIVEIGAIRFVPGEGSKATEHGAIACLVRPGIRMPPQVIAIHGITDDDVEHSPPFVEVAPVLSALAAGTYIVAHNAPFDLSFMRSELARAGLPTPLNPVLDTRILAKAAFPGLPSYRLVDLAQRFGIDTGRSHRALDDARTCMELLLVCAARVTRAW